MKRALITGITGQDGAYLAQLLLDQGYRVHGTHRPSSPTGPARLGAIGVAARVQLLPLDPNDGRAVEQTLRDVAPDEVYNLAAQTSVAASFDDPLSTMAADADAVAALLEAARRVRRQARIFQASTAEMFGSSPPPQSEDTPFQPCSPYAVAKLAGHWMTAIYRRRHGLFACSGILFNHESPLRGEQFVSGKIARGVARIKRGLAPTLTLGNLDARRDWGFARDHMRAAWLMLQQRQPEDYVIATGTAHSVRDFVHAAFAHVGLDWRDHVRQDPALVRPAEPECLVGDATRARRRLGWEPQVSFAELVRLLVDGELARLDAETAGGTAPAGDP